MQEDEILARFRAFVDALNRNDRRGANNEAFALIAGKAALGLRWKSVAQVLKTNGEFEAANDAMALYAAAHPENPYVQFEQAATLAQTGRIDAAWALMQNVPSDVPDLAGHAYILGTIAVNRGEIEIAQSLLIDALAANPQSGQAMLALAASGKMTAENPIGDHILTLAKDMDGAPDLERAHQFYACGRVHFDREESDLAFNAFSQGAALVRQVRSYDRATDTKNAEACIRNYTGAAIADIGAAVTTDTSRPIFVTGLPRSGTTLVEQILVSHSAVSGGEELGKFSILERDLGGPEFDRLNTYLKSHSPDDIADIYLHLSSERFGDLGRFVDKSLNTSRYLGIISAALPDAPIIWLRRNPLDCAWSAFRTYFLQGLDWSWRLEDIAHHFSLEDQLFRQWKALLGDRILEMDYQDLVTHPKANISRILAHCNLAEEPAVFEPHKTKRVVSTASVMQVRQPINTLAIDSAGPYRRHLQPFIDAYEAS